MILKCFLHSLIKLISHSFYNIILILHIQTLLYFRGKILAFSNILHYKENTLTLSWSLSFTSLWEFSSRCISVNFWLFLRGFPDLVSCVRWACSSSLCLWEPAVMLSSSQCMHSSVCAWPPTAAESPTEAAPRASGCLAHQDGSIVESTCAHTPGPLPAVAALRHPPCPGPGPGCPGVPSCWQQQQNQYLLQASCSTCWLRYGCWQSHTGIQTHTKISNQLP